MNRNNINDISAHRKQKKHDQNMLRVIVFCALAIIVLLIVLNWQSIVRPFEGIGRKTITEAGFPVKLPGSASYTITPFDNGFMLLTETYAYVHDSDGAQRYNRQHAYSEPQSSVGNTRMLIYDRNGRRFSFFGRNGLIYEKDTEERILYGAIGDNNSAAIVYKSAIYSNVLEIYDSQGDCRYIRRFSDENIMQIAFTSSDNDIIISTIGFRGGDMTAAVQKFDTSVEDAATWKTNLPINLIPLAVHTVGNSVFVLCDNEIFILDLSNGDILGSYSFRGNLIDFAFSDNSNASTACALLINDYTAGSVNLISLTDVAELISNREVISGSSQVELCKNTGAIYVLKPGVITVYEEGKNYDEEETEAIRLKEEYSCFIQVGSEVLLLGYNTVDRLSDNTE